MSYVNPYLVYPDKVPKRWVIQEHYRGKGIKDLTKREIRAIVKAGYKDMVSPKTKTLKKALDKIRGCSVHLDFRLERNGYLVGYTILGNRTFDWCIKPDKYGNRCRIEWKASQPLAWLNVEGYVPPKEDEPDAVGSTVHEGGLFHIQDTGKYWVGALKPHFHEYFIDGEVFKQKRVVVRGIKAQALDPQTKRPIPNVWELLWFIIMPKDQTPFAFSKRARKTLWIPPPNVKPYPPWVPEEEVKEWEEWLETAKEQVKEEWEKEVEGEYAFHLIKWKGIAPIRNMPQLIYVLYLKIGSKIYAFNFERFDPTLQTGLMAIVIPNVNKKWFLHKGKFPPRTLFTPIKEIKAEDVLLAHGKFKAKRGKMNNREVWKIKFKGKVKFIAYLIQEEEGSEVYDYFITNERKLASDKFVYDEHIVNQRKHWDLRFSYQDSLVEFNLYGDLLTSDEPVPAIKKTGDDLSWLEPQAVTTFEREVNGLPTIVNRLDYGSIEVFNFSNSFISFYLHGKKLNGYYVALSETPLQWRVEPSVLPHPVILSNEAGNPEYTCFNPPLLQHHRGYDEWILFDIRYFTRAEPNWRKYLPNLKLPPFVLDINLALYKPEGKIHHARVQSIFTVKNTSMEDVVRFVEKNKLCEFNAPMIREKHK